MKRGERSTRWIFSYWPLLLLTFDFAVLYGIAIVQPGDSRSVFVLVISLVIGPCYWIIVKMAIDESRRRACRMILDADPESKVAYVRCELDASTAGELLANGTIDSPDVPSSSYLVVRPSQVELRHRSSRCAPWLVLEWSQVLGAGASAEIYNGREYETVDMDRGVRFRSGEVKVRFLCTLDVSPGIPVPLHVNGQGAGGVEGSPDHTASTISEIINARAHHRAAAADESSRGSPSPDEAGAPPDASTSPAGRPSWATRDD